MSRPFRAPLARRGFLAVSSLAALLACSSSPGGAGTTGEAGTQSRFPAGPYDNCSFATFLGTPGGGGVSGQGGVVVVNQTGSTLGVSYGGDGGDGVLDASFEFTQTSDNSATLPAGQQLAGVQVVCAPLELVAGALPEFTPGVAQLGSGSLTYNAGTLFLSVSGTVEPVDAGGGCSNPGGQAVFLVTCGNDAAADGGAGQIASSAGLPGNDFVGVYDCSSVGVESSAAVTGGFSGWGALTITKTGNLLTASYADDVEVSGTLDFVATTNNAAFPATPNETMQVECLGGAIGAPPVSQALPVSSSTLTLDGSLVVLSFAGIGCGGAQMNVSLLCALRTGDAGTGDAGGGDAGLSTPH